MRLRWTLVIFLFVGCHGAVGVQRAEVLPTPFPGTLVSLDPAPGSCVQTGCPFNYRVQITNPTDGYANVQECTLQTPHVRIPVMPVAGVGIAARSTKAVEAHYLLPIEKDAAEGLVGREVTCPGLEWHGNAPI
jgi:hypothetical protein